MTDQISVTFDDFDRSGKPMRKTLKRATASYRDHDFLFATGLSIQDPSAHAIQFFPGGYEFEKSIQRAISYRNRLDATIELLKLEKAAYDAEQAQHKADHEAEKEIFLANYEKIQEERGRDLLELPAKLARLGKSNAEIAAAMQSMVAEHAQEDAQYLGDY